MENPTDKYRLRLKRQLYRRVRCGGNNVAFTNVEPNYDRARQVEPCHRLGWSSQALILSILALGAMPKQQARLLVAPDSDFPLGEASLGTSSVCLAKPTEPTDSKLFTQCRSIKTQPLFLYVNPGQVF